MDGQGLAFWKAKDHKLVFRPHTVDFIQVDHATITGPTFTQNPDHVLELNCNNCELSHINVFNPPSSGACDATHSCAQNTDAVDVHGERQSRAQVPQPHATLTPSGVCRLAVFHSQRQLHHR